MLMWRYARSHPHTVLYGFIGFVLAALILILGLWNTIVIAVFVFVGATLGQVRDGDNAIVNFLASYLTGTKPRQEYHMAEIEQTNSEDTQDQVEEFVAVAAEPEDGAAVTVDADADDRYEELVESEDSLTYPMA